MIGMLVDKKGAVLVAILIAYNLLLGVFVAMVTTQPGIVLLFLSVDFFLLFYYFFTIIRERLKVYEFKKAHAEIIKKAEEEVSDGT
jgi:hypothetical protein